MKRERIAGGDTICKNDMRLRGQNLDLSKQIDANPFFPTTLGLGNNYVVANYAKHIDVPTFMVASWEDEQVGGHAPTMVDDLPKHDTYVTLINGNHTEGLAVPEVLQRWLDFLQLYVGHEKPNTSALKTLDPTVVNQIINAPVTTKTLPMPADPYQAEPTYAAALKAFQAQPASSCCSTWAAPRASPRACPSRASRSAPRACGARHRAHHLVPRRRRLAQHHPRRRAADGSAGSVERVRVRPTSARSLDRPRERQHLGQAPQLRLGPAGTRQIALVPQPAAGPRHGDGRLGQREPVAEVLGRRHRPAGDPVRGPPRRQGDAGADRLAAGRQAQARPDGVHRRCSRCRPNWPPTPRPFRPGSSRRSGWRSAFGHAFRGAGSRVRITALRPAVTGRCGRS